MFELVSPEAQIVVNYPKTKIYHIGTRNNQTYKELDVDIGIEKPKLYELDSLEKVIEASKNMSKDEEGFVIVDKKYNRIKIKSPSYLMAHYLIGNGNFTDKRIIDIIKNGEQNEILSYFPEFKENFDTINSKINIYIGNIYLLYAQLLEIKDKKNFVEYTKKNFDGNKFYFLTKLYDNPNVNIKLELLKLTSDKIEEIIK